MTILKSTNFKSRSVIIPVVGKVKFDEQGCIEVDDSSVEALLKIPELGLTLAKEAPKKASKNINPEPSAVGEPVLDQSDEVEPTVSNEQLIEALKEKTFNELKALVKDYPKEETKKLTTKETMVNYLISKL